MCKALFILINLRFIQFISPILGEGGLIFNIYIGFAGTKNYCRNSEDNRANLCDYNRTEYRKLNLNPSAVIDKMQRIFHTPERSGVLH